MTDAVADKQTKGFETEVTQLLDIMIHSLYSNKEIFLRELISNASDAADKLRFVALDNSDAYEGDGELKIWIDIDKDAKTVTIRDNGIGMTRDEVIEHLGTIAKSGTKAFFNSLTGDEAKDAQLIGQFGVGFYSCFIVADKVTVVSRKTGQAADAAVKWESAGKGDYTVETVTQTERGTAVTLHMKEGEEEFLTPYRIQHVVRTYSDHISLPIVMQKEVEVEAQGDDAEKPADDQPKATVVEDEVVNQATALWTRNKSDIEPEQYQSFYKHISHDFNEALTWAHNRVEGKLEYTSLLFIPSVAPFDLWDPNRARGLKLYIKRVFILEDAEQLVPSYLRFLRGVIDSNDLPLNVSREILQRSRIIDSIRGGVVKRVFSMLEALAENDKEKYQAFWDQFGRVLKEGPAEDHENRDRIAKLLRFASTHTDSDKETVSLGEYLSRAKPEQKKIYYLAADSYNAAKSSPHLEAYREKGIEVLLLTDKVDEWLMAHLTEFEEKTFQSVAKGSFDGEELDSESVTEEAKAEKEAEAETFAPLLEKMTTNLGERVKEVRLTYRLTDSPSCIVADEDGMTAQMERILQAAGQEVSSKPILELNPKHVLIERLKNEADESKFNDWAQLLLDQAILSEGGQLESPATFVKRFNDLLLSVTQ